MKIIFVITSMIAAVAVLAVGCGEAAEPSAESSAAVEEMAETSAEETSDAEAAAESESVNDAEEIFFAENEYKSGAVSIDYKEFLRNQDYIGTRVCVNVRILQDLDTYYRCEDADYNEYIINDKRVDNGALVKLLVDDEVTVYGEYAGTTEVTRAINNTTEDVFTIDARYITLNDGTNRGASELPQEYMENANAYENEETEGYGSATGADYMLPGSSERYLTMADLSGMDYSSLRIAKNEIYARHGRMFASEDLDSYFRQQSWYAPTIPADQFTDDMLTEIEKKNVELINNAMSTVEGTGQLVTVQDTTSGYASRGLVVNDSIAIPQKNGMYEYSAANGNFVIAVVTNGIFEFSLYDSGDNMLDGCFNMVNMNDTEYGDEQGYYSAWFDSFGSILHLNCMGEQTDYTFKSFDPS